MNKHVCTFLGCEARFSRPYKLQIHLRKHSGERPFVCSEDDCSKAYTNSSHLRRHKLRAHKKDSKTCKCTIDDCGRDFINVDNLKRHIRNFHSKNYTCAICNNAFHKKNQLRNHMLVHTGELSCEYCPRKFSNLTVFNKHKRNHKSYTCSCGEIFYRWSLLIKHRREKHNQKYSCKTCGKQYVCRRNFEIHLTSHESTEKEIFECPMKNCERLYYHKKNLRCHIEVYHMKLVKKIPPSKMNNKSEINPTKTLKTERKPRKDKGEMKKSTALKITGLQTSFSAEKKILKGEGFSDSNVEIETSDFSDIEVSWKIVQNENVSDTDSTRSEMILVK